MDKTESHKGIQHPEVRLEIEITEPSPEELFPGVNRTAAAWAAQHGGEISARFWPDKITETVQKKIKEVIAASFLKKGAMEEVAANIRSACGFSAPSHPKPSDLRKAECPYCQKALKRIPGAKTKCAQCGKFMYVRTRPEDGARVVVTEAEASLINGAWETRRIACEPDDLATTIAETEVSQAQVNANLDALKRSGIVKKIRWLTLGRNPCPTCKCNDGEVRKIGEKFPSGDTMPLAHQGCNCILTAVLDD